MTCLWQQKRHKSPCGNLFGPQQTTAGQHVACLTAGHVYFTESVVLHNCVYAELFHVVSLLVGTCIFCHLALSHSSTFSLTRRQIEFLLANPAGLMTNRGRNRWRQRSGSLTHLREASLTRTQAVNSITPSSAHRQVTWPQAQPSPPPSPVSHTLQRPVSGRPVWCGQENKMLQTLW